MDSEATSLAPTLGTLRLLQLCSPAFPIGTFAYSQGLEQAIERQWVHDAASLREWCSGVLRHHLTCTDLPLLKRSMDLWLSPSERIAGGTAAQKLTLEVLAFRETAELRAEEKLMGRALARVLTHLGLTEAEAFVEAEDASFVVLFGLAAARWQIPEATALSGYALAWLENQLSASTRLVRVGQLAVQGILSSLLTDVCAAATSAAVLPWDEVGYSSPGFFLASAWHETQYSRLFRS